MPEVEQVVVSEPSQEGQAPESTAETVKPEAEQVSAEPSQETPAAPEADDVPRFTQKQLDEAVLRRDAKRIRQAERLGYEKALREAAQRETERLRAIQQPPQPPVGSSGEPRPDQFKDYETYTRALARWEIRQELAEMQGKATSDKERQEAEQQATLLRQKLSPGSEKYEDFEEVAFAEDVPITTPMVAAMIESAIPSDVAYFLGSHREEALRISKLSPASQVREIDKIVATLTKPKEPTKAPAPIVPSTPTGTVRKDPNDMTMREYIAWRRRSEAASGSAA